MSRSKWNKGMYTGNAPRDASRGARAPGAKRRSDPPHSKDRARAQRAAKRHRCAHDARAKSVPGSETATPGLGRSLVEAPEPGTRDSPPGQGVG